MRRTIAIIMIWLCMVLLIPVGSILVGVFMVSLAEHLFGQLTPFNVVFSGFLICLPFGIVGGVLTALSSWLLHPPITRQFPLSDADHAAIKKIIERQPEMIVSAAIRVGKVIVTVERPGRHGDCINFLDRLGLDYREGHGFLTNRGRFVDRQEAGKIARAAGQAVARELCNHNLFSEDLWNDWDVTPTGRVTQA